MRHAIGVKTILTGIVAMLGVTMKTTAPRVKTLNLQLMRI